MALVGITKKKRSVRSMPRKTGWVGSDSGQPNNGDPRSVLRSKYQEISNLIKDKRDDISEAGSNKFKTIIDKVEQLHQSVKNPREQVSDAETLLYLTKIIGTAIKSQLSGELKPSDFISCLLRCYATTAESGGTDGASLSFVHWQELGHAVSPVFMRFTGCSTMVGPMKMKQRKAATRRAQTKRSKTPTSYPKELGVTDEKEKTDTDTNMATMFDILKNKMSIRLESLILNRTSFAQTVENLFMLSFLVKDGRAEITIDENGFHLVAPKDAPSAMSVQSGEAVYNHFVFRFDFQDWQLMMDTVPVGKELMPHRSYFNSNTRSSLEITQKCDQAPSKNPLIEEQSAKEIPLDEREFSKFHEISSGCDEDVCKDSVIEISSGCSGDANSRRYPFIDISSQEGDTDEDSEVVEIIQDNRNTCSFKQEYV